MSWIFASLSTTSWMSTLALCVSVVQTLDLRRSVSIAGVCCCAEPEAPPAPAAAGGASVSAPPPSALPAARSSAASALAARASSSSCMSRVARLLTTRTPIVAKIRKATPATMAAIHAPCAVVTSSTSE